MKKNTLYKANPILLTVGVMLLMLMPVVLLAQGNGGSGSGGSSGGGSSQGIHEPGTGLVDPELKESTQQQLRDQDRIDEPQQDRDRLRDQDCVPGTDCDQTQDKDRVRDQDRIQDPAFIFGDGTTSPDQDRLQDRDRLRDQDCVPGTDCDQTQDRDRDRLQVHTPDELRSAIQEQQRLMTTSEDGVGEQVQQIHRNQNQVRVAAMALSSSSDLLGPIGPAVSRIAQDFDNSVQATIQAEEQIQNRSRLARFFFGSDDEEIANLSGHLEQNQNRVQELNRLITAWDGDPQVQAILQEQIQNMEQEQFRLRQIVDEESASRGLFGFLFGWLY